MKKFSEIEYIRPDFEEIKKDFLEILSKIESATTYEVQRDLIYEINRLIMTFDTASTMVEIRFSLDTNDKFYEAEQEWVDNTLPEFSVLTEKYYGLIIKSKFRDLLEKEFGEQLFTIADFKIKSIDERIVEERKLENKLCSEYSSLLAPEKIDFNGEKVSIGQLYAFSASKDRTIRKKASNAIFNYHGEKREELDRIFDDLVHLRHSMANKLGLNNFVELGYIQMMRSDYTPEMITKYRKKIQDYIVPLNEKLKKRQAKRIGVDSLKDYDIGFRFKSGSPEPKGNPASIIENGKKMYKELSPETDAFFNFMNEHELMDLEAKEGKGNWAYCTTLPSYGVPFVFSNFNGTAGDITILTHEIGHAFQAYESRGFKVMDYLWSTQDSSEIHSMSMEFFTWPWMELFFKEDTEKYKYQHLMRSLTEFSWCAAVDEFQHRVYEKPEMTPAERNVVWTEIEKKYKPNLDYDGNKYAEEGRQWQQLDLVYEIPFYFIDYALAQVCALQFWVKMQEDFKGAWKDYLRLCKAGGSMSFLKLVELAGLKSPFEDGTIEEVVAKVEKYLDAVDDSKF